MERKLNALHKSKSKSNPDLHKLGSNTRSAAGQFARVKNTDDELHELCVLSGLKIDVDVFKIVLDLLRLNVNPNTMADVLRNLSQQQQHPNNPVLHRRLSKSAENLIGLEHADFDLNV